MRVPVVVIVAVVSHDPYPQQQRLAGASMTVPALGRGAW
jgi:hypothetical protein